jgi:L-asparaginase
MDTRVLSIRLVPGFDDGIIRTLLEHSTKHSLKALILQLYGTGNIPSVKESFVQLLADATSKGIMVVSATQCHTGKGALSIP